MHDTKQSVSLRIPIPIYLTLKRKAASEGVSFTDIVIEALEQYTGDTVIGMCKNCNTQNSIEANYCSACGEPISAGKTKSIIHKLDDLCLRIEKLEKKK